MAFSRSLSEFAAVIMFGGNVLGLTQVLASYIFTKVEEGEIEMAATSSAFCILFVCFDSFDASTKGEEVCLKLWKLKKVW